MPDTIQTLTRSLRQFAQEREWAPFHAPKNLACALSVEAAELLEHFQWQTEEQSRVLSESQRAEVAAEAADVFLYLLQLCDQLGIDLAQAAHAKLERNREKYPVALAKGRSGKVLP